MDKKINWKLLSISLIIMTISLAAIFFIESYWTADLTGGINTWRSLILTFTQAILITALAVAVWDFIAKKEFAIEILNLAKLSNNIESSGVKHKYEDFVNVEWEGILSHTNNLKMAVSYGTTWRRTYREHLKKIGKTKSSLHVFLPNYKNKVVLAELSNRFKKKPKDLAKIIGEAYEEFKEYGAVVYLYDGCFQSSFFITDQEAVISFYNHQGTYTSVPAIVVNKNGSIFRFIENELNGIERNSIIAEDV